MNGKIIIMRLAIKGTKMIPERPTFGGKSLSLTFFNDKDVSFQMADSFFVFFKLICNFLLIF